MTGLDREASLEEEICTHLAAHGLPREPDAAVRHDRARGFFCDDLLASVQATQPEAWGALARAIVAVSRLATLPGIAEAEINPLIIRGEGQGVAIADAWVVRA